jgi:hypothetical protein
VEHLTTALETVGIALLLTAAWLTGITVGLAATGLTCIGVSYTITRQPKRRRR